MNQFRGSESHRGDAVIFSKKKIAIFRGSRTSEPDISKTGKLTPIFFVLYPHYIDHSGDFKPTPVKIYGVVFEQSESDPSTYTYLTLLPGGKWPLLNVNCSAAGFAVCGVFGPPASRRGVARTVQTYPNHVCLFKLSIVLYCIVLYTFT